MSSLEFNAHLQYATTPQSAALNALFASPFSVDFWFKPNSNGSTWPNMAYVMQYGVWNAGGFTFATFWDSGLLYFNIGGTGSGGHLITSAGDITVGQWHHIVMVYDGSAKFIYVNGAQVATQAHSTGGPASTIPFYVGTRHDHSVYHQTDGLIDEIKLWSRALTASEISTFYSNGTISTTSLDYYWPLNEGSGTTATDSQSGAILTLSGAGWGAQAPLPSPPPSVDGIVAMSLGDGDDVVISIGKMDIS